jgi:hypothetical protein
VYSGLKSAAIPSSTKTRTISIDVDEQPSDECSLINVDYETLDALSAEIDSWHPSILDPLKTTEFPKVEFLKNRHRQLWAPLLAIAYLAGDEWYKRAVNACAFFTNDGKKYSEQHNVIYTMCRIFFSELHPNRVSTDNVLNALGWGRWQGERLTKVLTDYDPDNTSRDIREKDYLGEWKTKAGRDWHKSFLTWNKYIKDDELEDIKLEADYIAGLSPERDALVKPYLDSRTLYKTRLAPQVVQRTVSTDNVTEIKTDVVVISSSDDDKEIDLSHVPREHRQGILDRYRQCKNEQRGITNG